MHDPAYCIWSDVNAWNKTVLIKWVTSCDIYHMDRYPNGLNSLTRKEVQSFSFCPFCAKRVKVGLSL